MAFEEVKTQKTYKGGYSDKTTKQPRFKVGEVLVEGIYIGTSPNKYDKEGTKPNLDFETEDGITVLNHSGHLSYLIKNFVRPGMKVQISYAGQDTLTKGAFAGDKAHQFKLAIDHENSRPTEPVSQTSITPDKTEDYSLDDMDD